jgi:hypothetical protein
MPRSGPSPKPKVWLPPSSHTASSVTARPCAWEPGTGASGGSDVQDSPSALHQSSFAFPAGQPFAGSPAV